MNTHTIDTLLARQMVEAAALRGASIIGQPGGWSVMLKIGKTEKPLGTQRTDKPRTWRSLDSCMTCLLYTSPSPRDRTRSRMPSSA